MSLTVETSQSEIQELRIAADYQGEVQLIVVKAFAETEDGSASALSSAVAERQLVTIEVRKSVILVYSWGRYLYQQTLLWTQESPVCDMCYNTKAAGVYVAVGITRRSNMSHKIVPKHNTQGPS